MKESRDTWFGGRRPTHRLKPPDDLPLSLICELGTVAQPIPGAPCLQHLAHRTISECTSDAFLRVLWPNGYIRGCAVTGLQKDRPSAAGVRRIACHGTKQVSPPVTSPRERGCSLRIGFLGPGHSPPSGAGLRCTDAVRAKRPAVVGRLTVVDGQPKPVTESIHWPRQNRVLQLSLVRVRVRSLGHWGQHPEVDRRIQRYDWYR